MGKTTAEQAKYSGDENTRREIARVIKSTSLIMCGYFIAVLLLFLLFPCEAIIVCGVAGCGVFLVAYHLSDVGKVKTAVTLVYIATIIYVLVFIYLFSWKGGAQTFLFIAPVLILISDFFDKKLKIMCGILACVLRFVMFYFHNMHTSIYELNDTALFYLEVINVISIFAFLCCCVIVFSEEVYALEQNLIQYNKVLTTLASEDPVTGLDNRRSILDYLKTLVDTYGRKVSKPFCVAVGDIDFFKKVNDTYGHECGDEVLRQLADLFSEYMESKGKVGRWGGEEFLFVFADTNGEKANVYLEDLLGKIRNKDFEYDGCHVPLTMTFGLEEYSANQGIDNVIVEADKKLYKGKETGRNKIIFKDE